MIDSICAINEAGSKPYNIADKFVIFCRLSLMLAEKKNLFFTPDMNFLLSKSAGENGLADLITDYDREKDFL
ncbi:MAG TPA: hypothetical protein VLM39_09185 [Ignavibacteriaceae bacterium]|nr:hypothetical protein [Ignavibacteriaceae bacterium]